MQSRPGTSASSLTLMFACISLVFVYMACVFPQVQLLLYFIASLFVMGVMLEKNFVLMIFFYAIVIGISLLLIPDITAIIPYVYFFGHYAIGKYLIDAANMRKKAIIIKLLYFNGAAALLYFTFPQILFSYCPEGMNFIVFIVILEFVFLAYDWVFTFLSSWYLQKIRNNLKRSTY